ncbi:MBOAT-domain-containing protein, partial [Ascobolus immersus RN42]
SGTSTPLTENAPLSAHATKHARHVQRRRMFPTVLYEPRPSHFDPSAPHGDFHGFFTLFWVGLFIMVVTTGLRNMKDTGKLMRTSIFSLLTDDLRRLAIADAAMVGSTLVCLPVQRGFATGRWWVRWDGAGHWMQHIVQLGWLAFWVWVPFGLGWQWTHQVFFTLHTLCMLMKIHSYSFYSGHLSTTLRRLEALDASDKRTEDEDTTELREQLAFELTAPCGTLSYPANLTLANFVDYLLCPTVCYELSYPRTEKIRWAKVVEKGAAIFGCVFLLTLISEEFIYPVMLDAAHRLESITTVSEILLILLESISHLLFPFILTFLLVFLVIFEYVLGAFAEITRFADRQFYADWWNSTNWLEFSREWNIPVHRFLQRHVYKAGASRLGKRGSMVLTFVVSAAAHELVMAVITKKLRGYGAAAMMMQLPLFAVQQLPWVRGWKTSMNVVFWISMIWGLSMVSTGRRLVCGIKLMGCRFRVCMC